MRVIVQRVKEASVSVDNKVISTIKKGYLLLIGLERTDTLKEIEFIAKKVGKLRIFSDKEGKMNQNINQVNGEILSISQFTLYGDTTKSNRPGFSDAMEYNAANQLYLQFNQLLRDEFQLKVLEGVFGEHMEVALVNDGPVTILIEKSNH